METYNLNEIKQFNKNLKIQLNDITAEYKRTYALLEQYVEKYHDTELEAKLQTLQY